MHEVTISNCFQNRMQYVSTTVLHPASPLLAGCIAASMATHALLLTLWPDWRVPQKEGPKPLIVEIIKPPKIVEPPKPLPLEPEPPRKVKPKPEPVTPIEQKRVEPAPQQQPQARALLTAAPEAPVSPQAPLIPIAEPKPAPPPPEPPRAQAAPPAPPAPQPVEPPRSDAAYLNNPRPNYPLAARRRGDHGTVLVRVLVTADGQAASVGLEKSSGHSSLDEAALAAVKSWRFVPARQGAQAVEAPYVVPVVFKLD